MLNIFPTLGKVAFKSCTVVDLKTDQEYEEKTCADALKFVNGVYRSDVLNFDHEDDAITFDYYKENFACVVDFHNSDEILEITCLNHLKELARDC